MNNKTLIIIIILIIIGFVGLVVWSQSLTKNNSTVLGTNNSNQAFLSADETRYDFGTISMANGLVDKVFKITNTTNQDITISSIVTSCMCTTAYLESAEGEVGPFGMPGHGGLIGSRISETLKIGESRNLKVVFDPNAHGPAGVGAINRAITLAGSNGGKLQLEIKVVVTP